MPEKSITDIPQDTTHRDVVCPFCALLCDDLVVRTRDGRTQILENACPRSAAGFERAPLAVQPTVAGRAASLEDAAKRAAQILARSKRPLIGGLGTDVDGVREALALAERCGGIVDHMHANAMANNVRVLQSRGWITTTLSELRNRADLVVLVGVSFADRYQHFFRRFIDPTTTLDGARRSNRRVYFMGPQKAAPTSDAVPVETLNCRPDQLDAMLGALRATLAGRPVHLRGVQQKQVAALAAAIRLARYPVFVWAPGQLDRQNGDVAIGQICGLVDALNVDGRAAGLFLGGDDGGQSAMSACAWLTGFPLRISYGGETIAYDPINFRSDRLLATNAVDALLWISSFGVSAPPPAGATIPTIAIGWPVDGAAVHIPAGTPGVDHAGRLVRTDTVVSLHLKPVRATALPSAADVLRAIAAAL
ncbi:MAG: formylmethanofuran dehydrogenase [Gammaproteobacteria bacterium]|nr:formylmethanofuran dehydrogenase [Gammaproteobacteria bacterium]